MNSEYAILSEAIAEGMFGSSFAGQPVYALPDSATLSNVLRKAGIEPGDQGEAAAFAHTVRTSLKIDEPGMAPLRWQAEAATRHRAQPLDTPPALPLLVLLTMAAEQMQADGDLAAHNYYSRVHRLLDVPAKQRPRVENNYRKIADLLWGSLNSWLEAWEGERGVPTAYAVGGHAYVGLPISQAVVRQHDRAGLHELFALEGLTPGLRISPGDMSAAIDPHATITPSPLSSHLTRLWRVPAARDRILDAACLELEAWDGSATDAVIANRQVAGTRLLAFLRRFPRKSLEFSLILPFRSDGPGVARFESAGGKVSLPTVVGPGGSTRLSGAGGVSGSSLVGDQLAGSFGHDESLQFGRRPKRVTPLRWDDLQGAYVEVERISLGEDSIILARSDARLRVEDHLAAHARPGWSQLVEAQPGIPEGWLVYQHVQMVSAPFGQVHADLLPLTSLTRTSLTFRGGFVLPGLLRKWSALEPPEAIALAAGASRIEVKVYRGTRIDSDFLVAEKSWAGELLVLSLAHSALADGEYMVAMFVDGAARAASTALLRLRSASTPQFRIEDVDIRLVYSPDSTSIWPLAAGPADWTSFVNGARTNGLVDASRSPSNQMREFAPRQRARDEPARSLVRIGTSMSADSCLLTGMHRFHLPTVVQGQAPTRSVQGECTTCGLVRRFAGTPWAAKKKIHANPTAVHLIDIPPISESTEPDFEVTFDALNHVGAGSVTAFERIAAQVEGSGLFGDSFLRRLEVAGHIDVARDDDLRITEWAMNSATLVPIAHRRWVWIGSRSQQLLDRVTRLVGERGKIIAGADAELARIEIVGTLPIDGLAKLGVQVLEVNPAMTIASALPHLSAIARSLRRVVVPIHRSAEFWDTASANWRATDTLIPIGAYRLKDFSSIYAVRSASDVESGTIGLGNAQVVKHIANLWAGDPLVRYHSRSGSVIAPLGADLPSLYGRALALCSGRAPREVREHRMLQYSAVPREVADIIFDRVSM